MDTSKTGFYPVAFPEQVAVRRAMTVAAVLTVVVVIGLGVLLTRGQGLIGVLAICLGFAIALAVVVPMLVRGMRHGTSGTGLRVGPEGLATERGALGVDVIPWTAVRQAAVVGDPSGTAMLQLLCDEQWVRGWDDWRAQVDPVHRSRPFPRVHPQHPSTIVFLDVTLLGPALEPFLTDLARHVPVQR